MTTANAGGAQPSSLAAIPIATLMQQRDELSAQMANLSKAVAAIDAEIASRYVPAFMDLLKQQGKDAGSITFVRDGFKMKGEVRKSVKWDSAKLHQIAAGMDWPTVQRLFKIEFSVAEATYKALLDDELRRKLDEARTVKLSAPSVSVIEPETV